MYTITVEMSVFANSKQHAIEEGQRLLTEYLDGTDFMSVQVIKAEPDMFEENETQNLE